MIELEIIFVLSTVALLVMWGWFTMLAFQTSRAWGFGLVFLFPLSPLMFAYRFERKTRKLIYPFLGSLLLFAIVSFYAFFVTTDFTETVVSQVEKVVPHIRSITKIEEEPVKKLNLPKPTPIPDKLPVKPQHTAEQDEKARKARIIHQYRTVNIGSAGSYIGKKVIISTASVEHRGQLTSVTDYGMEVKKSMAGGQTQMVIPKSKIEKFEVYQ